jgi:23S rRNA (adenine2503-C2)-methyltransferase
MEFEKSEDGTVKFNFEEGYSAVLVPLGGKMTLCLSSQIGCAMKCEFCVSGKREFKRNLGLEELKGQLDAATNYLGLKDLKNKENKKGGVFLRDKITAIVFMGMGEPMFNLSNVMKFCDYVNNFYGYAYSGITISTSGILPGMKRVIEGTNKIQLAVSLHSPFQEVRDRIMPGLRNFKVDELVELCRKYNERYRQKIMIEYLMIDGLTDRDCDLKRLIELGLGKRTNFNLIFLNSNFELENKKYEASSKDRAGYFRDKLMEAGYKCFTRMSMGTDIEAACGMLK